MYLYRYWYEMCPTKHDDLVRDATRDLQSRCAKLEEKYPRAVVDAAAEAVAEERDV